jgi:hypothetical protein
MTNNCSLCNARPERGEKHQPWCPKSDEPIELIKKESTFEFQQSIRAALPARDPEVPALRNGMFIRYVEGVPKSVHIGNIPAGATSREYRRLPNYYPAWVASHTIDRVMRLGERKYPNHPYLQISIEEHFTHFFEHVYALQRGDTSEPHLEHAMTRAAFILDILERELLAV